MKYKESLSIIFMRDNGPRRSFRVRRGLFYTVLCFFACLPLLSAGLGWQCWKLWQDNGILRANMLRVGMSVIPTVDVTAPGMRMLRPGKAG